jgi:hypothetical protein
MLLPWNRCPLNADPSGGLAMAGISHVCTVSRVAEMLSEDENLLQEISIDMEPEDACLTIRGPGEEATTAFTHDSVNNLTELVKMVKTNPACSGAVPRASYLDAVLTGAHRRLK